MMPFFPILTAVRSRAATSARRGLATHLRPPREPSFGKALLRKPISLAVIAEQPNRRPSSAPENENTATDWVFTELVMANANKTINALASIHRFDRHQHAHLRRNMNHRS